MAINGWHWRGAERSGATLPGLKYWLFVVAARFGGELFGQHRWLYAAKQVAIGTLLLVGYLLATRRARYAGAERALCLALWAHRDTRLSGYQLRRVAGVKMGQLYYLLANLERRGWVVAEWGEPFEGRNGKPVRRRLYRLTRIGVDKVFRIITPPANPQPDSPINQPRSI
jgi:hypothetical protein